MRSTARWLRRPIDTLIAIWFVLVMVEPASLHACPVHGDHETATVNADAAHAGHAAHDTSAPADRGHDGCTCPGACTVSSVGSAVPSVPAIVAEGPLARATVSLHGALLREPVRAPFVLPFANGPPGPPRPA